MRVTDTGVSGMPQVEGGAKEGAQNVRFAVKLPGAA
jgi:hypothetical protein